MITFNTVMVDTNFHDFMLAFRTTLAMFIDPIIAESRRDLIELRFSKNGNFPTLLRIPHSVTNTQNYFMRAFDLILARVDCSIEKAKHKLRSSFMPAFHNSSSFFATDWTLIVHVYFDSLNLIKSSLLLNNL
jgi:hypothetical protein